ncbi:LysM peptidoglycan-binding domain-containing protein [Aureibacillus halotolerans]|uniref:Nucleoid-associated protein YgaU n=1 Tax=Aureibacillus halotolerans TaxID=1508390 RepID=A0A4R6TS38_9BACI|nr:LysM peptidoglycan-binding domain-containing protein [Aureibacillus halotolerans]TDQ35287.1 nucleoid-associated protein YgaU [Aureibacillus halotolerans]
MYEFHLSFRNNSEAIQIPVLPGQIDLGNDSQDESVQISGLGETTIIQDPRLKTFSFESFFPSKWSPLCNVPAVVRPWEIVNTIERWKDSTEPIRFIITNTPINYAVSIQSFNYYEKGGEVGDLYYTLELKEYRFVKAKKIKTDAKGKGKKSSGRPDTKKSGKTYTVAKGDSLWRIAKKELGSGDRYGEIAKLNNIKAPYTIQPAQKLKLPS